MVTHVDRQSGGTLRPCTVRGVPLHSFNPVNRGGRGMDSTHLPTEGPAFERSCTVNGFCLTRTRVYGG